MANFTSFNGQGNQGVGDLWSGLGNMFTGNLDWQRTQSQNAFNASESQKQRNYESQMSNTAYQRAVSDMREAGLNPAMLYGSGGSGASTPSGATARGENYSSQHNGFNLLGKLVLSVASMAASSAQAAKNAETSLRNQKILMKDKADIDSALLNQKGVLNLENTRQLGENARDLEKTRQRHRKDIEKMKNDFFKTNREIEHNFSMKKSAEDVENYKDKRVFDYWQNKGIYPREDVFHRGKQLMSGEKSKSSLAKENGRYAMSKLGSKIRFEQKYGKGSYEQLKKIYKKK